MAKLMVRSMPYRRATAVGLVVVAMLAACGTQAPAPPDEAFYRLQTGPRALPAARAARPLGGTLRVRRFTAESLLGQRPLVYAAEDATRQLAQYRYDSWADEPTRMLQRLTVDALRAADAADVVVNSDLDAYADYELDGAITRLEHLPGTRSSVRIGVEFALSCDRGADLLLLRKFEDSEAAEDDSVGAAVRAFDRALDRVLGLLVRALAQARECSAA